MWTSHRSRLDSTKWPLKSPVMVGSAVPVQEGPIQGPAQWRSCYGPRFARPGCHRGTGSSPGSPASHPAPCLWPGKAVEDGPKLWDLHLRGRPGRGSWLWIGIASTVALTWGVNHRTEDLPLCISSLYICLSNKK